MNWLSLHIASGASLFSGALLLIVGVLFTAEIRALTGWLLDEGCPSVGLLGFSFGGWLAGLTACSDARITCAVLTVPGVCMRCSQPVVWPRVREALQALRPAHEAMDTTRLNLTL